MLKVMSEFEELEAIIGLHDIAMSSMMYYLSIMSGYLIVAYAVGRSLTRTQVIFITTLFVVFAIFAVWSTVGHMANARKIQWQSEAARPLVTWIEPHALVLFMQVLGIVGALKFMWDIRHTKSE
jgi:hypothetical protein